MKKISFAKFETKIELPELLELQKNSYKEFLQQDVEPEKRENKGLHQAFLDVFGDYKLDEGIENSDGSLKLQYLYYTLDKPRITPDDAIAKDLTYDAPLRVWFRLLQKLETGKIKELSEQEVYLCDIPIMTESGSFIINGAERVVVTQIHRSPGVIFEEDEEKIISQLGKRLYKGSIIPYRGAWLDFEFDANNVLFVRIDKKRKIPVTVLLRAIGFESNEEILQIFYDEEIVHKEKFSECVGKILAEDAVDKKTGEVIREALQEIRKEHIKELEEKVDKVKVLKLDPELNDLAILLTLKVDPTKSKKEAIDLIYKILRTPEFVTPEIAEGYLDSLFFKNRRYDLTKVGRFKINKKLGKILTDLEKNPKYSQFKFSFPSERKRVLTKEDIIATIKYIIGLNNGLPDFEVDDIDHLGNRRIRAVGELLENQIRIGLVNMVRFIREKMNTSDNKATLTPRAIINVAPLVLTIRRFFGTSQLSQFMDKTNPLAELTHKRRLSALGPGGLHRKRAGFEVRDVHYTHYGRICPIETPEGPNIGLVGHLASYARINPYGFIETPYRKVKKGQVTKEIVYLDAFEEEQHIIASASTNIDKNGKITDTQVEARIYGQPGFCQAKEVEFIDISPYQIFSVSTALIPFVEHDDAARALMGSNMQRQAVPLIKPEAPLVGTGLEEKVAQDSGHLIVAKSSGKIIECDANHITILKSNGTTDTYQ
ncbi:MAG: DNA-directed RNA polymerase subunit beta, partial [Endomicrobiia bacterium]